MNADSFLPKADLNNEVSKLRTCRQESAGEIDRACILSIYTGVKSVHFEASTILHIHLHSQSLGNA